ncbi:MAG: CDC27 family protein [Bacteroidales bacterium]|nr:CDC27 family protein [Bacteroidales bacterium]
MMCRFKNTRWILFTIAFIMINTTLFAQKERKYTRQGNRSYMDNKYTDSEILYRRALEEDPGFERASFNLADALFKQEEYEEAAEKFRSISDGGSEYVPESYYNLGNSLLKANKIEESINAYKNALRRDPGNLKAKYNLAYAQDLLKQQEEQQNKQDKEDKQDKKNDNKDNRDSDSEQSKDNESEQEQDKNDQQQENNKPDEQKNDQQQQQQQMTKQDAERLLQALAENEKEVQEKVKKAKAAQARVKTLKNW